MKSTYGVGNQVTHPSPKRTIRSKAMVVTITSMVEITMVVGDVTRNTDSGNSRYTSAIPSMIRKLL